MMNVLKLCVVLSGISVVLGGIKAQAEGQRVSISPYADLHFAKLYANRPFLVAVYVAWMERYTEEALVRSVEGKPFISRFQPRDRGVVPGRWTWFAANGDSVRRTGVGRFRVYFRNYHANWFSTLDCAELQWPMFRCQNGVQMTMSVTAANGVVFGDVEYNIDVEGRQ